ncbi:MAG: hypothetical protein H7Z38_02195 [Rubrivivax sp.]|nr:hypothetical protein [Pyrinomonadaceae bacterium]
MPASDNDSGDLARAAFREAFKDARLPVAARLALKIKLARLSDSECSEVLDYIEVMQSLGARDSQSSRGRGASSAE